MTATRITAYTPNGPSLGPLPVPQDLQVGYPLNDVGALAFQYAPEAPRSDLLGQPLELAVEVSYDQGMTWVEPPSSRFLYLRDGRDPVKTGDAYAVEAAAIVKRLDKALVGFQGLNSEGTREFSEATPGAILATLWDAAQTRGALEGLERSWNATTDSAGTQWPEVVPQIAYDPGTHLLAVLQGLVDMGLVDYRTRGRTVDLFVAGSATGMGADRSVGPNPVTLRAGRDLTEAPFRRTWEGLADTAMILGENATNVERTNPAAIRPWGRQETYGTASGVGDTGTLTTIADAILALSERERAEHTFGLDFRAATHLPFRDYGPGEWVLAAVDGKPPQRMRLHQVTLTRGDDGNAAGNVVLNDRFLEGDSATNRRIQKILNGANPVGPGTPGTTPGGNDILAPAAPTGLGGHSTAYVRDDGQVRSQITLNWDDVTTNADGTITSDVDHYEVWRREAGVGDWVLIGQTGASVWYSSDYEPGTVWSFRVRAVDRVWNRGAFSAPYDVNAARDTEPPPRPAKPVVTSRLGVARVNWYGRTENDGAQPPDYFQTEYHVSTVNNVNQSPSATRVGETRGPGYAVAGPLNYGTTYYAWVVSYDTSLNKSQASETVAFTVAPLVDVSNFPDDAMETLYARTAHFIDVTADMIQANQVQTMHLDTGAVTAEKLSVYSRRENMLPNGWMEELTPAGDRPNLWAMWYYVGSPPTVTKTPTGQAISGAHSLRISAPANGGWTVGSDNGNWLPVVPGQFMTVRGLFRPQQAIPAGKTLGVRLTTAPPGASPAAFPPNASWQTATIAGPLTAGQTYTVEASFQVPTGHTQAGIMVTSDANTAATTVDVDGVELFPAVTDAEITEVGAGKVKTGILQATTRVIAGSSTGSRVELSGTGLKAYNASNAQTFLIDTAGNVTMKGAITSGSTITGALIGTGVIGGAAPVVRLGSYTNPVTGTAQGMIEFHPQGGLDWDQGRVFAQFWNDGGNWAAVRMYAPHWSGSSALTAPAFVDVRNRDDGHTEVHLRGRKVYFTSTSFVFNSQDDSVVDFTLGLANLNVLSFRGKNAAGMIDLTFGEGTYGTQQTIKAFSANWSAANLMLQATGIILNPTNAGSDFAFQQAQQGALYAGVVGRGGFRFGTDKVHVQDWYTDSWKILKVWTVETGSDPSLKENAQKVQAGALAAVRASQVYDYDPAGADEWNRATNAPQVARGRRFRGLMADELLETMPEVVTQDAEPGKGEGLGVDLYALLATTVAAVQELADQVDMLKRPPNQSRSLR